IGKGASVWASSRWRSRPLSPGRRTSSTRHPGEFGRGLLRNACALGKTWTVSPTEVKSLRRESRTDLSSSITKMTGSVVLIPTGRYHDVARLKKCQRVAFLPKAYRLLQPFRICRPRNGAGDAAVS